MSSDIEWLLGPDGTKGFAWNPLLGCTPISPGCLHCYAATLASRGMCEEHRGLTRSAKRRNAAGKLVALPVFNSVVHMHPERLREPLRKSKVGKRVFVNSMSDLFHEDVSFEYIAAVYAVMALADWHTFLVLTKRPARAVEFFEWLSDDVFHKINHAARMWIPGFEDGAVYPTQQHGMVADRPWPPRNVQLGVSAENQPLFDERVPQILRCPAAVHWVSIEPQLDCIDPSSMLAREEGPSLGWVVVGGESGAGARPYDVSWARLVVDACVVGGTPVFVKQLGGNPNDMGRKLHLADGKGADANEWSSERLSRLRRREIIHGAELRLHRFAA